MIINPFIEIEPKEKEWILSDYLHRQRYIINRKTIIVIIDFIQGNKMSKKVKELLIKRGILVDEDDAEVKYFYDIKKSWEKYGWIESFKYHIATLDYPFQGNLKKASLKMEQYQLEEADNLREKQYSPEKILKIYSLPKVKREQKSRFEASLEDSFKRKLFRMLSMTFGYVQEAIPEWGGKELLFRTIPSGGARQPSEGYLYVKDIEELDSGWYYINGKKFTLEKISDYIIPNEIFEKSYSLAVSNTDINIRATIILTSVFEKNMYRYRESRTFRSIHMDIGFLLGALEELSDESEIASFIQYGLPESYFEGVLGLNYLEEGYQASIVLGKRKN